MKRFKVNSYQSGETGKWIPAGKLYETNDDLNELASVMKSEFKNTSFETEQEANDYFSKYWFESGYRKN